MTAITLQQEIKRRLRARKSGSREKREMKDMYARRKKIKSVVEKRSE